MTSSRRLKKTVGILLLATMYASVVCGQTSKESLAVYVSGSGDENIKKVIGAKLVSAITKYSDDYAAVERTAEFLSKLNEEQSYQRSGNVDDNQFATLGKQFGVKVVVVADVMDVLGSCFVAARMINVETALVTATADGEKELKTASDLFSLADEVASKLVKSVDVCSRKDKPVGDNGCCDGLVIVDGYCRDISNGMVWLNNNCNIVFAYEQGQSGSTPNVTTVKYSEANCPAGYRWPTISELNCLVKSYSIFNSGYWWTEKGVEYAPGMEREWGKAVEYDNGEWKSYSNIGYSRLVDNRWSDQPNQITIQKNTKANCLCVREQ